MNLCSHQVSNCPVSTPLRQSPPREQFRGQRGRNKCLPLLGLGVDVFQRCLSAQPAPKALQGSNRGKFAHLLRDLAATADLPPRCQLFALQLLDLTHRWWSETEAPDIEEGDVYSLAAPAYV